MKRRRLSENAAKLTQPFGYLTPHINKHPDQVFVSKLRYFDCVHVYVYYCKIKTLEIYWALYLYALSVVNMLKVLKEILKQNTKLLPS